MTDPVCIFNFCDRDSYQMGRLLDWMVTLDGKQSHDCVLAIDSTMNRVLANVLIEKATRAFEGVSEFRYERPWQVTWPHAGNHCFRAVATLMATEVKRPFLWHEADMIPIVPGWLPFIFDRYAASCARGKPYMGSLIPGNGHLNGTALYDFNFANIAHEAMTSREIAWDFVAVKDIRHLQSDCPEMVHRWGLKDGKPHPSEGTALEFRTEKNFHDWVPKGCVSFHRSKDCGLINVLEAMRNKIPPVEAVSTGGGGGLLRL